MLDGPRRLLIHGLINACSQMLALHFTAASRLCIRGYNCLCLEKLLLGPQLGIILLSVL